MEELIAWILVIAALCVVLPFTFKYILAGLYWFLAALAFFTFALVDEAFSAALLPGAPWVMWMLWGALIGAALGFWMIAPIFGLRHRRPLIVAAPFALMALVAVVRIALRAC